MIEGSSPTTFRLRLSEAFFLSLLVSCASGEHDHAVLREPVLAEDQGIVVFAVIATAHDSHGKLLAGEDTPAVHYSLSFGPATAVTLKQIAPIFGVVGSADTRGSVWSDLDEQLEFVAARKLRSGEYSMYDLKASVGGFNAESTSFPLDLRFTSVPNRITYIGTLHIDFVSVWGLLGDLPARKVKITVYDDQEVALADFREKNPSLGYEVETYLLYDAE